MVFSHSWKFVILLAFCTRMFKIPVYIQDWFAHSCLWAWVMVSFSGRHDSEARKCCIFCCCWRDKHFRHPCMKAHTGWLHWFLWTVSVQVWAYVISIWNFIWFSLQLGYSLILVKKLISRVICNILKRILIQTCLLILLSASCLDVGTWGFYLLVLLFYSFVFWFSFFFSFFEVISKSIFPNF